MKCRDDKGWYENVMSNSTIGSVMVFMGLKDTNQVTSISQMIEHTSSTVRDQCVVEIPTKEELSNIER